MTTKFTSGPWKVDYQDNRGGNIIAPSGPVANTRWFGVTHKQVMEDYANADLIAAAPELYEALEAFVGKIDPACLVENDLRESHLADELRAAFAALGKARGDSPQPPVVYCPICGEDEQGDHQCPPLDPDGGER